MHFTRGRLRAVAGLMEPSWMCDPDGLLNFVLIGALTATGLLKIAKSVYSTASVVRTSPTASASRALMHTSVLSNKICR